MLFLASRGKLPSFDRFCTAALTLADTYNENE
jgi:hypothetical protein